MPKHPYLEFEDTAAWNALNNAISELEANQDLRLLTLKEYVIGYICRKLSEVELLTESALDVTDL